MAGTSKYLSRKEGKITTTETVLIIASETGNSKKFVGKERHIVEIYVDSTACENQSVAQGTPCFWVGFDKNAEKIYGKPKNQNKP